MGNLARKITLVFGAGCLGGLVNSLAVWICGLFGITAALGVKIAPQLSATWLYPRIVWGGIWGLRNLGISLFAADYAKEFVTQEFAFQPGTNTGTIICGLSHESKQGRYGS
jgi:hypothetical protein